GRARVLERPLADPGLHELEVDDARDAPAPAERQPDDELEREQAEDRPPAGHGRDQRQHADRELVGPRRTPVDHVEVVVGVGQPVHGLDPNSSGSVCSVTDDFALETPRGPTAGPIDMPARAAAVVVLGHRARAGPGAAVVLGHGAGSGMGSPFMAGIARALVAEGLAVARFDFPYMHAGRKAPDAAPALLETWRLARDDAAERTGGLPLVAGGKSLGGRIASMAVAEGMPAEALVLLGYPLHPPGRTDKLRRDHLADVRVPMLFLQGSRDAFA